jgi:mRNA interferase RelE/StbE
MSDGSHWRVVITSRAEKELKRLTPQDQQRVRVAIDTLVAGLDRGQVRKLRGKDNEWRIRVGDWRVRFGVDEAARTVVVLRVAPRGRAYRD